MKFSIRDLLLVTVIVALAVGWWVDRAQLREQVNRITIEKSVAIDDLAKARADLAKLMSWDGPYPPNSSAPVQNPPNP